MYDEIYDLAAWAARSARIDLGQPYWTPQDWEDMQQEAAATISSIERASRKTQFVYARWRVMGAWVRQCVAHNPNSTLGIEFAEKVQVSEPEPESSLSDFIKAQVGYLLRRTRSQNSKRVDNGVETAVKVLDLLIGGYNNEGIALELKTSVENVKRLRSRLKDALSQAASEAGFTPDEVQQLRKRSSTYVDRRSYAKRGGKPRKYTKPLDGAKGDCHDTIE